MNMGRYEPALRPAPAPHVPRLARNYQQVEKRLVDYSQYPSGAPSILPSLQDIGLVQGFLANEKNFASEDSCEIAELGIRSGDQAFRSSQTLKGAGVLSYFEVRPFEL